MRHEERASLQPRYWRIGFGSPSEECTLKSLVDLQTQIEALQKEAAVVRSREYKKTVTQILALMRAFGITFEELRRAEGRKSPGRPPKARGGATRGRPKAAAKSPRRSAKGKVKVKFRGPGGATWTGRGKQPRWLKALVDAGRTVEEFRAE